MMVDQYQSQLSWTENALHSQEKEIEWFQSSHAAELGRIAQQLLQFCKEDLEKKDRKCAGHINGRTGQPSQQENMAGMFIPNDKFKVDTLGYLGQASLTCLTSWGSTSTERQMESVRLKGSL